MKIRTDIMVEQPIVFPIGTSPIQLLNEIAQRGAYETATFQDDEADVIKCVWKLPAGAEVDIPTKAAMALIGFGYAKAIN